MKPMERLLSLRVRIWLMEELWIARVRHFLKNFLAVDSAFLRKFMTLDPGFEPLIIWDLYKYIFFFFYEVGIIKSHSIFYREEKKLILIHLQSLSWVLLEKKFFTNRRDLTCRIRMACCLTMSIHLGRIFWSSIPCNRTCIRACASSSVLSCWRFGRCELQ